MARREAGGFGLHGEVVHLGILVLLGFLFQDPVHVWRTQPHTSQDQPWGRTCDTCRPPSSDTTDFKCGHVSTDRSCTYGAAAGLTFVASFFWRMVLRLHHHADRNATTSTKRTSEDEECARVGVPSSSAVACAASSSVNPKLSWWCGTKEVQRECWNAHRR